MNPSLYSLVVLIAVKMLTVKSAPLISLEDVELTKNHESSYTSATTTIVDQDYNKEKKDFSEAPEDHETSPTSASATAPRTNTPDTEEKSSAAIDEAAAVTLLKRALRNKRHCSPGMWGCNRPTASSALHRTKSGLHRIKSRRNRKSHHKQRHS